MSDLPEMVEAVAIAIKESFYGKRTHWDDCTQEIRIEMRRAAEFAIRRMRDPTDDLAESASYQDGEWSRRNVEAYVDAILN